MSLWHYLYYNYSFEKKILRCPTSSVGTNWKILTFWSCFILILVMFKLRGHLRHKFNRKMELFSHFFGDRSRISSMAKMRVIFQKSLCIGATDWSRNWCTTNHNHCLIAPFCQLWAVFYFVSSWAPAGRVLGWQSYHI